MQPIYQPTGKAKEYGDYAINIYTGCPYYDENINAEQCTVNGMKPITRAPQSWQYIVSPDWESELTPHGEGERR